MVRNSQHAERNFTLSVLRSPEVQTPETCSRSHCIGHRDMRCLRELVAALSPNDDLTRACVEIANELWDGQQNLENLLRIVIDAISEHVTNPDT